MDTEQLLLEKWRSLPQDLQKEVIDFVEFLELKKTSATKHKASPKPKPPLGERLRKWELSSCSTIDPEPPLGERLRKLRKEIVASGVPRLDWEGVEREKAERRGGYQEDAE